MNNENDAKYQEENTRKEEKKVRKQRESKPKFDVETDDRVKINLTISTKINRLLDLYIEYLKVKFDRNVNSGSKDALASIIFEAGLLSDQAFLNWVKENKNAGTSGAKKMGAPADNQTTNHNNLNGKSKDANKAENSEKKNDLTAKVMDQTETLFPPN